MTHLRAIAPSDLEKLGAFDTCTLSNALERLNVRMRNEGFVSGAIRCQFPNQRPMVAYAATARIRTTIPPMTHRCYHDRPDWWKFVASLPKPSVMVLQDVEPTPGVGAVVGEIHAAIGLALNCVGCVTNGAVRDLPAVEAMGFHLFAQSVAVSHSYSHIIEFGEPVEVGGLKIHSGDLLHGDRHGVLAIPLDVASQLPVEATKVVEQERELVQFCRSAEFSLNELSERISRANADCDLPWLRR